MTRKYSKDHEWVEIGDVGIATVGITDFAQKELGDVVYVELPEIGTNIVQNGDVAVVESVKAASDVKAPISGEVVAVNEALGDNPEIVNSDAEGAAWFFKVKPSNPDEPGSLMDKDEYDKLTG
ncbi:MAG: glycine cleavage system protein GcvH [Gammaproteobacteria bacterium]